MPQFVQNVEEIRQRAIQKIEDGAVTSSYGLDKDKAISILNEALATEIVCVLRYMHHYFMATGVHGRSVADEFKEHADAEREHAEELAERIQQLGGKPDFNPKSLLERSASQYVEGETLADMIREDLIAERVVIEVYTEMIRFFGDKDPTTRTLLEHILNEEEEHASELADLLYITNPHTGETEGQDPGTDILKETGRGRDGNRKPAHASREMPQKKSAQSTAQQGSSSPRQSGRQEVPASDREEDGEAENNQVSAIDLTDSLQEVTGGKAPRKPAETTEAVNRRNQPAGNRSGGSKANQAVVSTAQQRPGQSGSNRSPKVNKPNRKNRAA